MENFKDSYAINIIAYANHLKHDIVFCNELWNEFYGMSLRKDQDILCFWTNFITSILFVVLFLDVRKLVEILVRNFYIKAETLITSSLSALLYHPVKVCTYF